MVQNETKKDMQAISDALRQTIDDALQFHSDRFGKEIKAEKYDDFELDHDPKLDYASRRGRSTSRNVQFDFRKPRQKSPCVQLGRPKRKTQQIETNRQGFCFTRNPSIPEMISTRSLESPQPSHSSMLGDSIGSIPSMLSSNISNSSHSIDAVSSVCSSSRSCILPADTSRSSSRNTFDFVQSAWTSTTSLYEEINVGEVGLEFEMPATEHSSQRKVS